MELATVIIKTWESREGWLSLAVYSSC